MDSEPQQVKPPTDPSWQALWGHLSEAEQIQLAADQDAASAQIIDKILSERETRQ